MTNPPSPALSAAPRPAAAVWSLPVLVAALGYFVDVYDLVLVGMVGKASVLALGVPEAAVTETLGRLLGLQMVGMLIGGFLWGHVADRHGRVATLFGSILTYSTATLLNGFVTDLGQYEILRVLAGVGLAGELGVGITLVMESLPPDRRAYGAVAVAAIGVSGSSLAWLANRHLAWNTAFIIGGLMGYGLLVLRWVAHESGLYAAQAAGAAKGSLGLLFSDGGRVLRYLRCLALGLPTWFVIGTFTYLAGRTAPALGVTAPVTAPDAILSCYTGLILSDIGAGFLTQALASRRRTLLGYLTAGAIGSATVLVLGATGRLAELSTAGYYLMVGFLGLTLGSWALFVTVAAEQFGTNLRATVATTVPNVSRGMFYPMQWLLFAAAPVLGYLPVAAGVGAVCFTVAILAAWTMTETHGTDLDFSETASGRSSP